MLFFKRDARQRKFIFKADFLVPFPNGNKGLSLLVMEVNGIKSVLGINQMGLL